MVKTITLETKHEDINTRGRMPMLPEHGPIDSPTLPDVDDLDDLLIDFMDPNDTWDGMGLL